MPDIVVMPNVTAPNGQAVRATFYETGTSTLVNVYSDTGLSVLHTSPLLTVDTEAGRFPQVFYNGAVELRVVFSDSNGVTLFTLDPTPTVSTDASGASDITFSPYVAGNVNESTVQDAIENVADQIVGLPIDEDDMASDSATRVPTQQSTKAYVDTEVAGLLIDEDNMASDSTTRAPTQQSTKAYVDTGVATRARIATGTYTGDGNATQAITGVGFEPVFLKIWERLAVNNDIWRWETTDQLLTSSLAVEESDGDDSPVMRDDRIVSLDSDGFTVGDGATGSQPNASGVVYSYLAIG